ncbi:MAG: NTP transferase domain-containing protein [Phycisphaerae bacterium]
MSNHRIERTGGAPFDPDTHSVGHGGPRDDAPRVWAVVPAAGLGRRMGFAKQAAAYQGSTMTAVVTSVLLESGVAGVVVVTRTPLVERLALPDDARVAIALNDLPDSEMIDSVRIGCDALLDDPFTTTPGRDGPAPATGLNRQSTIDNRQSPRCPPAEPDGLLVLPADMPHVAVATCRVCIRAYMDQPTRIVVATVADKRAHPIIFPLALNQELQALTGKGGTATGGLRGLVDRHPRRLHLVSTSDPGAGRDIDTPSDYDR